MRKLLFGIAFLFAAGIAVSSYSAAPAEAATNPDWEVVEEVEGWDLDSIVLDDDTTVWVGDSVEVDSVAYTPYAYSLDEWKALFKEMKGDIEDIHMSESGMIYKIFNPGEDAHPKPTSTVTVAYEGAFMDGQVFDAATTENPLTAKLNMLIPGWTEAVQLIGKGGKISIVLPYWLAYGETGAGGVIPPYESLMFQIELIDFK